MATKIDLFERVKTLPPVIQGILSEYSECENYYETCEALHSELLQHGYTFDWGLDAIPTNLRKIELKIDLNTFIVAEYLLIKKVPFAIKTDFSTMNKTIFGVKRTKDGKFYRANGKIIAGNMAKFILNTKK